jgi:uncharacterized membrane protein YjgN (DUF898 family)
MITAILIWLVAGVVATGVVAWTAWAVAMHYQVFGTFFGYIFSGDVIRGGCELVGSILEAAAKAAGEAMNNS